MSARTYDRLADLPLTVEGYRFTPRALEFPGGFTRVTTEIWIGGAGEEGVGEDVCYDPADHQAMFQAGPALPLAGSWTLRSFSEHLDGLELFPRPPAFPFHREYRRWAFESAALDLALRQAGLSLAGALGIEPRPVTFVTSMRLDDPPSAARVLQWLQRDPGLRFKLDPTSDWGVDLIAELARTGAVVTVDLKGQYTGTPVDGEADPELYARLAEALPDAWIEDPRLTPETRAALDGHWDRVTWDASIHSVDDIRALEHKPRMINMKPSRFGRLSELLDAHDHLQAEGIGAYGGGQTELGLGRGQIQYLASLFHPDAPNDVAPRGYNEPVPPADLPASPLEPAHWETGFRWGD
jgi:L-alanine-DL-glutamate epimerase-like enolase superfamily enzyme